ncbi:MAG: YfhO family protein [Eubacterium sp.]|nr:YfhO family protein [Eubacterium sp.]
MKHKGNRQFFKNNWSWFLAGLITIVFMLIVMIMNKVAPFGQQSFTLVDSIHQYVPFFSDYQDKLKNFKSLTYTWDVGMGMNFQALLLYYMASPLNLLLVFCSRKGIIGLMSLLISLKISISSATFGFYLSRRGKRITNNFLILALSLAFGLNNYMISYYWNIMWLDCIMVFPLIILGYERLIERKDPRLYTLALFYSMYCNYYISFMICIFLVLWFLASGHKGIKAFFTDGIRFASYSIMAAGMAAVSLFMAFFSIMTTASAGAQIPKWEWYQSFWELVKSIFFTTKAMSMNSFDGPANLYCGTLPLLMLVIYIFTFSIEELWEKVGRIILIAIFIISMNNKLLNFIWHGFHDQYGIPNRFSFMLIFLLLVISYDAVVSIKKTHYISITAGAIVTAGLMMMIFKKTELSTNISPKIAVIISALLVLTYAMFLLMRRVSTVTTRVSTVLISLLMICEILTNAGLAYNERGVADGAYYMKYTEEMEELVGQIDEKSQAEGLKFYRQDVVNPIMLDENTFDNVKGVGTFCTTARGDMVKTMAYMGFYTMANEYLYLGATPFTNDIFGVRYAYVREGDYFPMKEDMTQVLSGKTTSVYENKDALPIAFGVDEALTSWDYESYNAASVLNDFAKLSAGSDDIFITKYPSLGVSGVDCSTSWDENAPTNVGYTGATGSNPKAIICFQVKEAGRYFINIRGNYLENLDYYVNDEKLASGRYMNQLLDLGYLASDDMVRFDARFSSSYSDSGSISVFTSMLNQSSLNNMNTILKTNGLNISQFRDGYVKGSIKLRNNQIVFTSIPFDEGWTVYVDGKKADVCKLGGAFLGFSASEGQHEVELKYVPVGFVPGLIVSICFWIAFVIFWINTKRRLAKEEGEEGPKDNKNIDKNEN